MMHGEIISRLLLSKTRNQLAKKHLYDSIRIMIRDFYIQKYSWINQMFASVDV